MSAASEGQLFVGRYRLLEPLGAGAFATVWHAVDDELDIDVAVKILADNWALDSGVRARFLSEARLLRRIDSDRTVRVYDLGEAANRPYFVMDLITGGTLADVVDSTPVGERLRLAAEAAFAVQVVHDAGVAHRDVKPSNLLVQKVDGEPDGVVVADLGTAKLLSDGSAFTMTAGTPAYMAPEQARGAVIDERCDVYSIAVVTYELLTGRLPFETESWFTLERGAVKPIAAGLGLASDLDRVLADALSIDPMRRPPNARTFGELLLRVASGQGVRGALAPRQWSRGSAALASIVLFISGFASAWWWVGR